MLRTICIPPTIENYLLYLFILLIIVSVCLYYIINYIYHLMMDGYTVTRKRYIVNEGFDTGNIVDASKSYYNDLLKRCDKLDLKIQNMTDTLNTTNSDFLELKPDICYVTNYIDDTLKKSYETPVPTDTNQDPDNLKKLGDIRKKNSDDYIKNLKQSFVQTHENIPLLECFDDGSNSQNSILPNENIELTDEQNKLVENVRAELETRMNQINSDIIIFDKNLEQIQKSISQEILKQYYTTLNYNDKYITAAKKQVDKAAEFGKQKKAELLNSIGKEGFTDKEVLDFSKSHNGINDTDSSIDQAQRIDALEIHCSESESNMKKISKSINQYKNTVIQQRAAVDDAKASTSTEEGRMKTLKTITSNI